MLLPITIYGDPVLRKVAQNVDKDYDGLEKLLDDMFQTMYSAEGVGLAGPQVGKSLRIFVVDATMMGDEEPELKDFKKVFLNAEILERTGDEWDMNEGCLSLPGIREDVSRPEQVTIRYCDENFVEHVETYNGFAARVIQHEYDHLEGIMFVDHLSPLRKRLLKGKLSAISKGKVRTEYRVKPIGK